LPYLECIQESRRAEFVEELVSLYCRRFPPDEIGRTHVKMVRLEVQARKEI
jgi:trans-aconitate methyltransferase